MTGRNQRPVGHTLLLLLFSTILLRCSAKWLWLGVQSQQRMQRSVDIAHDEATCEANKSRDAEVDVDCLSR